jgi:predicted permease
MDTFVQSSLTCDRVLTGRCLANGHILHIFILLASDTTCPILIIVFYHQVNIYVAFFPGLFFDLENGGDVFLQNIGFQTTWHYTLEDCTLQIVCIISNIYLYIHIYIYKVAAPV